MTSSKSRTSALTLLALGVAVSAAFSSAAMAGGTSNPYSPAYNNEYRHGVIPTRSVQQLMRTWASTHGVHTAAANSPTLSSGGGVGGVEVMSGQNKVYLVFYGTQWGTSSTDANGNLKFTNDTAGAAGAAQQMFKGIGTNAETWQNDLTQWCNGAASGATSCAAGLTRIPRQSNILTGVWYDNSVASPAVATGTQLAQEAIKAAAHFGNTATGSNRSTYYVILSPKGTNPDSYQGSYCAWHDYTGDGYGVTAPGGDLAFSNQPYNIDSGAGCGVGFVNSPGTLDGYTMTLGHEWQEMMSDQFPAGGFTNHNTGTYAGQENSDECAWIAKGAAGGAANITFSTGTFAEQASWSNDTNNCAITHADVSGGGGGNAAPVANFSFTTSNLVATFTDSSTDSDGSIASHAWNFGDSSTSTATSPSHTYAAAGTYSVSETVTDNLGATNTKTASVTVTTGGACGGTVLCSGVSVALASQAKSTTSPNYTIVVPAGQTKVVFTISGGTGDADLYVRRGSAPTTSTYDCRPYTTGNAETCTFTSPTAGTYYANVRAYAAYSGVSLKATITP